MARVTLYNPGTGRISSSTLYGAMLRAARRIVNELKQTAPVSTGRSGPLRRGELGGHPASGKHLSETFEMKVRANEIDIVTTAPHFSAVTEGSKPHTITGNPWLYFPMVDRLGGKRSSGKVSKRKHRLVKGQNVEVFKAVQRVHHPGHRANPFFSKVVKKAQSILREEIQRVT